MDERPIWQQKFDVERVKREGLDADLERLERDGYDSLTPEEFYRLKMHGVCSQRTPGLHMIRLRVAGGRVRAAQLRGLRDVSAEFADGDAHITTRQNLELHSVASRSVRRALEAIHATGLSSNSSCGHTVRNIVACTQGGICPDESFDVSPTVTALNDFFLERAAHYNARLPRRVNVYVAGCSSCMSHAQVNDLGFVGLARGDEHGFQLWCAGSLGSNPRLAHLIFGFVPQDEAVAVAEAVADVYCEHGFRDKAAKARMKFLLAEWGEDRFAGVVLDRLREIRPDARTERGDVLPVLGSDRRSPGEHGGVFPQRQEGFVRIEARVPLGDLTATQMTVLADLADAHEGIVWLTREQNAELHWIPAGDAPGVAAALRDARLRPDGAASLVDVQVCAGTEWCVWGVGDSRGMARDLEGTLSALVQTDRVAEPLRVHISGCSHGCAQHQVADVGLAAVSVRDGAGAGTCAGFELYGGGRLGVDPAAARRLGKVPAPTTPTALVEMLARYVASRAPGETFASFLERADAKTVLAIEPAEADA